MIPNFDLFGKTMSAYLIIALIGILATLFFTYRFAQKKGLDEINVLYIMLFAFGGALIGGHILYGITNFPLLVAFFQNIMEISSFEDFINKISIIFGGSVFYGGLLGGLLSAYLYMKKAKIPFDQYADLCILAAPFFHIFGRIGCFLSGCCYGIECKYGVIYHYAAVEAANQVPRLPVQLIEAICNLGIFFLLLYLYQKKKQQGNLIYLYLMIYPTVRFILEFFRGDEIRGFLWKFSTSQWISILLFLFAFIQLLRKYYKHRKQTQST
jgi:phosphatidylglycerol:prolipoprotein diacylglycerol transferase